MRCTAMRNIWHYNKITIGSSLLDGNKHSGSQDFSEFSGVEWFNPRNKYVIASCLVCRATQIHKLDWSVSTTDRPDIYRTKFKHR